MPNLLNVLTLVAQTEPASSPSPGAGMQSFMFMIILIFAAFYFIILRPQGKERKDREKQLAALGKGDRVVTVGGLHGAVTKLGKAGKTIELELAKNLRVVVNRSAVASITKRSKERADANGDQTEEME